METNTNFLIQTFKNGITLSIINKLKANALQKKGFDTVEANLQSGLSADGRDFVS